MFKLSKMHDTIGKGEHLPFCCGGGSCAPHPCPTVGAPGAQVRQGEAASQKPNRAIFSSSPGLDFGSLHTAQIWFSSSLAGLWGRRRACSHQCLHRSQCGMWEADFLASPQQELNFHMAGCMYIDTHTQSFNYPSPLCRT